MKAIADIFTSLIEGTVAIVVIALTFAFILSPLIFVGWLIWLVAR